MEEKMSNYSSFGKRLGGYILDLLISLSGSLFLIYVVFAFFENDFLMMEKGLLWVLFYVVFISFFVNVCYLSFTTYYFGGSIGKLLMGMKVCDGRGRNLSMKMSFFRYLVGYPLAKILFGFGFLWVIKDERKQGFHDKMTGSFVVNTGELGVVRFFASFLILVLMVIFFSTQSYYVFKSRSIGMQITWQIQDHVKRFELFFDQIREVIEEGKDGEGEELKDVVEYKFSDDVEKEL